MSSHPSPYHFTVRDEGAGTTRRSYIVTRRGSAVIIGTVAHRRGGWWAAWDVTGHSCGSWHRTRRAAAASIDEHLAARAEAQDVVDATEAE